MPTIVTVSADNLNDVIEFDCPFTISEENAETYFKLATDYDKYSVETEIETNVNEYAPNYWNNAVMSNSWSTWSDGYTGQYSYNGPVMHSSEYLGGYMAINLLSTAGTFVIVAAQYSANVDSAGAFTTTDRNDIEVDVINEYGEPVDIYGQNLPDETEGWVVLRLND